MKEILHHKKAKDKLLKKGYVVVDFAAPSKISQLYNFYTSNPQTTSDTFHTTHFSTDVAYKTLVHNHIISFLQNELFNQFNNYTAVFANFMVKEGGGNNPMPLHADWTYVEEDMTESFAIWIPLIDTTIENGCIGVIPYSHQLSCKIRGPRILQWEPPIGDTLIERTGELIPMKIGQALIYNHRTLHYSLPNNSLKIRPAINISLVPNGSQIIHYTMPKGEKKILKFEVEDCSFFLDYNNFEMPARGRKLSQLISTPELIDTRVVAFINGHYKSQRTISKIAEAIKNWL
jgi:hypothetical protein